MSSPTSSRTRLHPAAIIALAVGGLLVISALTFLAWFLSTQQSDPNAEATDRLVHWQEIFEKYRTENGSLPDVPLGGYCLGDGFPIGVGGTANCRDIDGANHYTEADSAALMNDLGTTGALPAGTSAAVRGTIGPYALYEEHAVQLLTAESAPCVAPAIDVWTDGEGLHICQITLTR
ncbi:hypothetical protein [Microbacterium trichothecenolyticum]|uniref:Uncharacterized protein n=1 Tax=Microbacterium trichothecenolyticum TaxID=69370 RepID=A0ABU0TYK4_MICTR|nr:hypothetical protein [Microbacterium trichothecenolyticum]MDQ1124738.1 hypothetical protein [Microbacterium trichothecenolyticum]